MKTKRVGVWNPKGGQGKSLLALNLAACAVKNHNLNVLVIDQDPQGTCQRCSKSGNLSFEVKGQMIDGDINGVDLVIIDHQASDWTLTPEKTVVMPVLPTRTQFETYALAYEMAKKEKKNIITVVTNAVLRRKEEEDAVLALSKEGAFILEASAAFGHAEAELTTIFDDRLNAKYKIKERRDEINNILISIIGEK